MNESGNLREIVGNTAGRTAQEPTAGARSVRGLTDANASLLEIDVAYRDVPEEASAELPLVTLTWRALKRGAAGRDQDRREIAAAFRRLEDTTGRIAAELDRATRLLAVRDGSEDGGELSRANAPSVEPPNRGQFPLIRSLPLVGTTFSPEAGGEGSCGGREGKGDQSVVWRGLNLAFNRMVQCLSEAGVRRVAPTGAFYEGELLDTFKNVAQEECPDIARPVVKEVLTPAILIHDRLFQVGEAVIGVPSAPSLPSLPSACSPHPGEAPPSRETGTRPASDGNRPEPLQDRQRQSTTE